MSVMTPVSIVEFLELDVMNASRLGRDIKQLSFMTKLAVYHAESIASLHRGRNGIAVVLLTLSCTRAGGDWDVLAVL